MEALKLLSDLCGILKAYLSSFIDCVPVCCFAGGFVSLGAWGFCIVLWVFCRQVSNEKMLMGLQKSFPSGASMF